MIKTNAVNYVDQAQAALENTFASLGNIKKFIENKHKSQSLEDYLRNEVNIIDTHMLQIALADLTVYVEDGIAYREGGTRFAKITRIQDEFVITYDKTVGQQKLERGVTL